MNKFFDPEGTFAHVMNIVLDLILLNVCWILCSLPIFTLGAATTSLYAVLIKMRDGDATKVVRRYFAAFRENFKRGTAVWLALLLAVAVCALDLYFAKRLDSDAVRVIALLAAVVVALTAESAFIMVARYENTWKEHLKNALLLSLSCAPRALLVLVLWGGMVALTFFSFNTMYIMIMLLVMAGFSCLCYATLWLFTPALKKLEPAPEEEEESIE